MSQGPAKKVGSDHGELGGLTDDDHTQYHTDARHFAEHGIGAWQRTTTQSINNATETTIIYNTLIREDDVNNDFTMNTGTGVVTINNTGWYFVAAGLRWASSATGRRIQNLRVNGNSKLGNEGTPVSSFSQACSIILYLTAGDTVDITGFHTHGSALNIDPSASGGTQIVIGRVA